jgi:hypothetical protein
MDIGNLLQEMLTAMQSTMKKGWKKLEPTAKHFLENRKENIQELTSLWLGGELTKEEYESRLEDEKLIWEAQLNAISAISKSTLQHSINAAIDVLRNIKIKFY